MAGNRSFKGYISDRFYNDFYSYIENYIEENQDSLDLDIQNVHDVGGVSLADMEVKFASINDLPGMEIKFDVAVEVIIQVSERDYHYDDYDVCNQWFLLNCSGNLESSLSDFKISGIELYTQRNKIDKPLSDALVPYMWADELDSVAYEFLKKNYPEALKEPMARWSPGTGTELQNIRMHTGTCPCCAFGEVQEGFKEVRGEIKETKDRVIIIEQEHGRKLDALFDGYKQNSEKLDRIEKEVSRHEEIILRRIK